MKKVYELKITLDIDIPIKDQINENIVGIRDRHKRKILFDDVNINKSIRKNKSTYDWEFTASLYGPRMIFYVMILTTTKEERVILKLKYGEMLNETL